METRNKTWLFPPLRFHIGPFLTASPSNFVFFYSLIYDRQKHSSLVRRLFHLHQKKGVASSMLHLFEGNQLSLKDFSAFIEVQDDYHSVRQPSETISVNWWIHYFSETLFFSNRWKRRAAKQIWVDPMATRSRSLPAVRNILWRHDERSLLFGQSFGTSLLFHSSPFSQFFLARLGLWWSAIHRVPLFLWVSLSRSDWWFSSYDDRSVFAIPSIIVVFRSRPKFVRSVKLLLRIHK